MRNSQHSLESLDSLTKGKTTTNNEAAAAKAQGQRERSRADTLRPRLYADARSLTNPLLKVRNLSHDARSEPIW